jgi:hypothetical protein
MDQFPPNSRKAAADREPKRVQRVTSDAVRRRRPLGKQFRNTFFGGDANTAIQYVIFNVLIPGAKDSIVEAGQGFIEKLVYGDARPRRGPMSNPLGQVSYHRMSQQQPQSRTSMPQALSRRARSRFAFDEIVIPSRQEAEEVLDRLFDLISKYDTATVADLYELTGLASSHIDHKWGWTALRGASVNRVRGGGYLLNLPEPESLG